MHHKNERESSIHLARGGCGSNTVLMGLFGLLALLEEGLRDLDVLLSMIRTTSIEGDFLGINRETGYAGDGYEDQRAEPL